jgi:hypothetical protein
MALNVCDSKGNHLGFLSKTHPEAPAIFMLALTHERIEDAGFDLTRVVSYLAGEFKTKSRFGKVDEERLIQELEATYGSHGFRDHHELFRYAFIQKALELNRLDLFRWVDINTDHIQIFGYLWLNIRILGVSSPCIEYDVALEHLPERPALDEAPVFATVIDIPVIKTEVMGAGEGLLLGASFSDFGGRNHSHHTSIRVISGNVKQRLSLPVMVPVKKGMAVELYYEEKNITKIYCDGLIYHWE